MNTRSKFPRGLARSFVLICLYAPAFVTPLFAAPASTQAETLPRRDAGARTEELFTDIAAASGLNFVHFNGMSGQYYFPEMTGPGGALLDYDRDGDLDVFAVQGTMLGKGKTMADALFPSKEKQPKDRLYRNDLIIHKDGRRELKFTDVTEASGINGTEYGMGATVGDFDNDGWIDIYVSNYGANRLWRNNGDGSFSDVTAKAGVDDPRWSTSAAFFDYDRDGWLDLYLANYVDYDLDKNIACYGHSSRRDYCGPAAFNPQPDRLFRNLGNGRFKDVTRSALRDYQAGPGLGVITADLDGNGLTDIYVANDGKPNQLWLNQGDGSFREDALFTGTAVNRAGRPEASMGVDAADFDGDGDMDLFMTHLMGETNTLYVNQGGGIFEDRGIETGLAAASMPYTSFGTAWFDYDNDGWLDLLVLNGGVAVIESLAAAGDKYPLEQNNQLFRNLNGKTFADVSAHAGPSFTQPEVSRGAAFGDLDNDGDTDVVVFNNNGPLNLLRNNTGQARNWLGLRLLDAKSGRDMPGARVSLMRKGKPPLWRHVRVDGSYCSANDARVLFGLGDDKQVDAVEIYWPSGRREQWRALSTNAYHELREGTANVVK